MENIFEFIARNMIAIGSIVVIALVTMAYISSSRFKLWVVDFWVTLPIIGTIARLSKDQTKGSEGWLRAEEKLCACYKPFVNLMTRDMFNQRIEYLRKAADLGRSPTPMFVWTLLVVLVIAEGLGFSYLLGSWMAREGSANTHTLLMFAIVLVLCVILVALTHFAGHQYYRTSLLRSCFARYKERGSAEYSVSTVSLNMDQSIDSKDPDFKQTINRVGKHSHDVGSYAGGIIAIIAIAFIAVVSTYMRVKNMEGELIRETSSIEQPMQSSSSNPFDTLVLPAEVQASQHSADSKAKTEAMDAVSSEGLAAFAMLGFIFVITQIVGMGAGYKYEFAGRESKKAYLGLGGFSTYEDYLAYFRPLRDMVNGRIKDLQQRIESKSHVKLELSKSFDDFLREQRQKDFDDQRTDDELNAPSPAAPVAVTVAVTAPTPVTVAVAEVPAAAPVVPAAAPAAPATTELLLTDVQQAIERLNDPESEKAYFLALPAEMRTNAALQTWLKARKATREADEAAKAAADDLF